MKHKINVIAVSYYKDHMLKRSYLRVVVYSQMVTKTHYSSLPSHITGLCLSGEVTIQN